MPQSHACHYHCDCVYVHPPKTGPACGSFGPLGKQPRVGVTQVQELALQEGGRPLHSVSPGPGVLVACRAWGQAAVSWSLRQFLLFPDPLDRRQTQTRPGELVSLPEFSAFRGFCVPFMCIAVIGGDF